MAAAKELVKAMVRDLSKREKALWHQMNSHSKDYIRFLELHDRELEILERSKKSYVANPGLAEIARSTFIRFFVEEKQFGLAAMKVSGATYGGLWVYAVMSLCVSDNTLNTSVGHGQSLITVIPAIWHQKLVQQIRGW